MRKLLSISTVVALTAVGFATCGAGLRSDEFLCEEAYAHLTSCCPGFTTEKGYCSYTSGCGGTHYPAISEEESNCIRSMSCDEIQRAGVCSRAAPLKPQYIDDDAGTAPYSRAKVCP